MHETLLAESAKHSAEESNGGGQAAVGSRVAPRKSSAGPMRVRPCQCCRELTATRCRSLHRAALRQAPAALHAQRDGPQL